MSYILEALKKSEQERRRGEVPEINRFEAATDEQGRKSWLWPAVAVILIAANLGILLVWAPWEDPNQSNAIAGAEPQSSVSATPVRTVPPPQPQITDTVRVAPAKPPAVKPREPVKTPVTTPEPVIEATAPVAQPEPEIIRPRSQPEVQPEPEIIRPSGSPRTTYLPQLQELPMNLQQRVPDMSFSSHMYSSEPRFRSIIINGRRLKEGQFLNDDLQVREITDKGVVLSLDGNLFEVDVLGQWVN